MTIIEVNFAGFQFTRSVPDIPWRRGRHAWHISRLISGLHHRPRVHPGRRRAAHLRVA